MRASQRLYIKIRKGWLKFKSVRESPGNFILFECAFVDIPSDNQSPKSICKKAVTTSKTQGILHPLNNINSN